MKNINNKYEELQTECRRLAHGIETWNMEDAYG